MKLRVANADALNDVHLEVNGEEIPVVGRSISGRWAELEYVCTLRKGENLVRVLNAEKKLPAIDVLELEPYRNRK